MGVKAVTLAAAVVLFFAGAAVGVRVGAPLASEEDTPTVAPPPAAETEAKKDAAAFEMSRLLADRAASGKPYLEFLRVPALSAGVYHLPKGGRDGQSPHGVDEVYYVAAGRARFTSGATGREETIDAKAGSVIYVKREIPHRFHDIEEDLSVLVVFANGK